jgi:putative tryptophan/tyrosine transport system substrate-binding protein
VRRREFISVLGVAATAWPLAAGAQPARMPVIGFLHSGSPEPNLKRVAAFRVALGEMGYVEGRNVVIDFRWAGGKEESLSDLAADLVRRNVAVIVTPASSQAALAAKAATATIPIVFAVAGDPVAMGLVATLNRPASNATGISNLHVELVAKRLEFLHELVPAATRISVLVNPRSALTDAIVRAAALSLGPKVEILHAQDDAEIDAAFTNLVQAPRAALLFTPDEFLFTRRARVIALAARYKIPTMYNARELVEIGGLVSYGPDTVDSYNQAGIYVGRILKGEKPSDLPVIQSSKFELVLNLKAARALGLTVPQTLLTFADEVFE